MAAVQEVLLDIEGMSCAGCVARVEKILAAQTGVARAEVNLVSKTARVSFDPDRVQPRAVAHGLTEGGYPAMPRAEGEFRPSDPGAEIARARRLALIAIALALPVFLTEMGGHLFPPLMHWLHGTLGRSLYWLQFVLTTLCLMWPGAGFFRKGVPALLSGAPEMNSLVALGTGAAWTYSTIVLLAPMLLPESARAVYFEAAAVIVALVLTGRWLEAQARGRTGEAIRALMALRPDTAWRHQDGQWVEVPVAALTAGDRVQIRAGAQIPVDGEVLLGQSYVDEAMITGEPMPVLKSPNDMVVGGTINGDALMEIRATAVGADTVLARIITTVQSAQDAKLPVQALADRVVRLFVPAVLAIALVTVLAWLLIDGSLTASLVAGVSVLIIACPCAMGLATPTAIMVGTGRAAELGVLFRKGDALQRIDGARVVAFDKTGTLTEGRPKVTEMVLAQGITATQILPMVAAVEATSDHPIAKAIVAQAGAGALARLSDTQTYPGLGIGAVVQGHDLLVGSQRLMTDRAITPSPNIAAQAETLGARGATLVYAAMDGTIAALFAIEDQIKPGAADAVRALGKNGLSVAMVTGDSAEAAAHVAQKLGITIVSAGVMPDEKAHAIETLRAQHGPVIFVGDGINDGPALAAADVGIAIGGGTDVAIEAADVVLSAGDVAAVVTAFRLSRKTMRNIRQNLFWAFAYNIALIPVAALGMITPVLAAGAMALSSVFVLGNALRLRKA